MSFTPFTIAISDVVDLLGLERNPRDRSGASSFNVKCPFCDDNGKKYHMNINTQKNVYFCPRCMDANAGNSGALDLYGRVRFGTPLRPGVNGKELYHKLCNELEGTKEFVNRHQPAVPEVSEILPAANADLDRAYSALLSLPYLTLSRKHGKNLIDRGLDADAIKSGRYVSLRKSKILLQKHPSAAQAEAWYEKKHVDCIKSKSEILKRYSRSDILMGVLIARDLVAQGVSLSGVPGFFKLAGAWCFRYESGMLIPTVAYDGCIVGLQVRRDTVRTGGVRYLTVSSKDLDSGVTTGISRTHVARKGEITDRTAVFLTEGPLKANVILHLMSADYADMAVVAVPGVNNTGELPQIADLLYDKGIRVIYSALDMDKCLNMYVAKAGRAMKELFESHHIQLKSLCWDKEFARVKYAELSEICARNDIPIPQTGNVFDDVYTMAEDLHRRQIEYDVYVIDGKRQTIHWGSRDGKGGFKGMDDYLNYKRKRSAG